jgi:hypothetical protein
MRPGPRHQFSSVTGARPQHRGTALVRQNLEGETLEGVGRTPPEQLRLDLYDPIALLLLNKAVPGGLVVLHDEAVRDAGLIGLQSGEGGLEERQSARDETDASTQDQGRSSLSPLGDVGHLGPVDKSPRHPPQPTRRQRRLRRRRP